MYYVYVLLWYIDLLGYDIDGCFVVVYLYIFSDILCKVIFYREIILGYIDVYILVVGICIEIYISL